MVADRLPARMEGDLTMIATTTILLIVFCLYKLGQMNEQQRQIMPDEF
jgi:hypothetical protein